MFRALKEVLAREGCTGYIGTKKLDIKKPVAGATGMRILIGFY